MFPLLIALIVFVVAGFGISALLNRLPSEASDLKQGLTHLAGLRWRELAKLVLQAMQARGYEVVGEMSGPADGLPIDGGDILLRNGSQRTLLSCKYGNASVVSAQSILGLGKSAQLRGAHSAIVVTPGTFDDEARRVAAQQHIELVDGPTLWPQVKPFVIHDIAHAALDAAPAVNGRNRAIAWGGAAACAAVAWMLAQAALEAPPLDPPIARPAVVAKAPTPTAPAPVVEAVPTDPAELERRRKESATAISTLSGVDRAIWATQSTLVVYLSSESADPSATLCPLLVRYPELAASRVQLQPPPGSQKMVRYKQCRAY